MDVILDGFHFKEPDAYRAEVALNESRTDARISSPRAGLRCFVLNQTRTAFTNGFL
jgi:hypothetical protein